MKPNLFQQLSKPDNSSSSGRQLSQGHDANGQNSQHKLSAFYKGQNSNNMQLGMHQTRINTLSNKNAIIQNRQGPQPNVQSMLSPGGGQAQQQSRQNTGWGSFFQQQSEQPQQRSFIQGLVAPSGMNVQTTQNSQNSQQNFNIQSSKKQMGNIGVNTKGNAKNGGNSQTINQPSKSGLSQNGVNTVSKLGLTMQSKIQSQNILKRNGSSGNVPQVMLGQQSNQTSTMLSFGGLQNGLTPKNPTLGGFGFKSGASKNKMKISSQGQNGPSSLKKKVPTPQITQPNSSQGFSRAMNSNLASVKQQPSNERSTLFSNSFLTGGATRQNKINKLQKQEKIVLGGDQNSQNSGPYLDVDDDDVEDSQPLYGQDISQQAANTGLATPQNSALKDRENLRKIGDQQQNSSSNQNDQSKDPEQSKQFLKQESESMHKLIKDLNEQAMTILYTQCQQNVSKDPSTQNGLQEYLVIQRKLSEMKASALQEPENSNYHEDDDQPQAVSDIQKSILILEKAQKILKVQREKGQLLVKPIYSSIVDYNIACCNQQINNLKKCDKLLGQSIQYLLEDINQIDGSIEQVTGQNQKQKVMNDKVRATLRYKHQMITQSSGQDSRTSPQKRFQQKQGGSFKSSKKLSVPIDSTDSSMRDQTPSILGKSRLYARHGSQADVSRGGTEKKTQFANYQNQQIVTRRLVESKKLQPLYQPVSLLYLKYTRQRQQAVLMLQHCAILSQLNRHQDALDISKATAFLINEITNIAGQIIKCKRENGEQRLDWADEVEYFEDIEFQIIANSNQDNEDGRSQTSKKERRGRNGRKPQSLSSLATNSYKANQQVRSPLETHDKRSTSQYSRGSRASFASGSNAGSRAASQYSKCLSQMSKTSQKSTKQINASLERMHTFGMSSIHKSKHDIEKIDTYYDSVKKNKKTDNKTIKKTASLHKLKDLIQPKDNKQGPPQTSLKFLRPKSITGNSIIDQESDFSEDISSKNSKVSASMNFQTNLSQDLLDSNTKKDKNQTVSFSQDQLNKIDLDGDSNNNDEDFQIMPDNMSSINSVGETSRRKNSQNKETKTSYYVRDKFKPLNSHQTNIEKLLVQFKEQQQQFIDIIMSSQPMQPNKQHSQSQFSTISDKNPLSPLGIIGSTDNLTHHGSVQKTLNRNFVVSQETIRNLKMSFQSIDEIERMKRDSNMYKQTQRNQLGVAKSSKIGEGNRRTSKLNWIDLFNIGNVMLMRGQDIQMSHQGWSQIGEFDNIIKSVFEQEDQMAQGKGSIPDFGASFKDNSNSGLGISQTMESAQPDLSLQKCGSYSIAKDSFTEIVLLSVISYFCVSTEQRFININSEKDNSSGNVQQDKVNRSLLNNSNQSLPLSGKSIHNKSGLGGLNSTLHRSTKDQTLTSSIQRPLGASGTNPLGLKRANQETRNSKNSILIRGASGALESSEPRILRDQTEDNTDQALEQQQKEEDDKIQAFNSDQQEYFLAKALHFGITYLPPESPLVQHLTQNYIKNYLQQKIDQREEMINRFIS